MRLRRPSPAVPPAHLVWVAGAAAFLFTGTSWSGGQAQAVELSAAETARHEVALAQAQRVALLGRLQLAGVAARRVGATSRPAVTRQPAVRRELHAASPGGETALVRYLDVLGPGSIQAAVQASASGLQQRVLTDSRIHLSGGGRADVASSRMDSRVLALLAYLAEAHGEVTASCLITGHSRYVAGRKGVVSAHVYGRAVDISSVGGVSIVGNQQPGGPVEAVIREILALPEAVRPAQVISLLDLSGPSFRLPDHADHLHVGY